MVSSPAGWVGSTQAGIPDRPILTAWPGPRHESRQIQLLARTLRAARLSGPCRRPARSGPPPEDPFARHSLRTGLTHDIPIGIAYPVGLVEGRRGPLKTFRLVLGKVELEGQWIIDRRVYVRLGESAEEL